MNSRSRAGPLRVLVVDDCPDTVESLTQLLRIWGFDAMGAGDGACALELSDSYQPVVVLLDLGLPGMDGLEVLRRLRGRQTTLRPLVVCLSGWASEEVRRRCLEAGCDLHLAKPADPELLRRWLGAHAGVGDGGGARQTTLSLGGS